tara:strand:+ start:47 stop:748 length:702 start_codon:yes stop_codon:yes gene_type:complete
MPSKPNKTMWDTLADKIGDFAEENLWGVDEQYFKDKYGDDWEGKQESARKNVRSLYGLIPQSSGKAKQDAVVYALTLLIGKPAGIALSRGVQQKAKTMIRGGQLYGGKKYEGDIFTTESPLIGSGYVEGMKYGKMAEKHVAGAGYADDIFFNRPVGGQGELIELDVPRSFMDRFAVGGSAWRDFGRFEYSGGRLIPGAREVQFKRTIPEEYIMNITPAREIIRNKLPELGRIR